MVPSRAHASHLPPLRRGFFRGLLRSAITQVRQTEPVVTPRFGPARYPLIDAPLGWPLFHSLGQLNLVALASSAPFTSLGPALGSFFGPGFLIQTERQCENGDDHCCDNEICEKFAIHASLRSPSSAWAQRGSGGFSDELALVLTFVRQ